MTAATITAIEAAAVARKALRAQREAVAAAQRRHRQLVVERQDLAAELERLTAAAHRDAGRRLLDGETLSDAELDSRIEDHRKRIAALESAAELQAGRVGELQAAVDPTDWNRAVLAVVAETAGDAEAEVRSALESLAEPLSRLMAAGELLQATLGDSFAIPAGATVPPDGRRMVLALLEALPNRFTAGNLDRTRITTTARAWATNILKEIENVG